MKISKLNLKNFRNYENLDLEFGKGINVLYGKNAQGKTNIIESIFMCSCGRSHRTTKDFELLKIDQPFFKIKLEFIRINNHNIEIEYIKNKKKEIKLDSQKLKRIGNLMGNLYAVIFSPEDLMIIKEGPSERRRFIDIVLSQIKPSYFFNLQQYYKILEQKNALLRNSQNYSDLINTIEVFNIQLADTGSKIIANRKEFLQKISDKSNIIHSRLTKKAEDLTLKYEVSIKSDEYKEENIKKIFLEELKKNIKKEFDRRTSIIGPQRDDYLIYVNNKSVKLYGSQGQQRTSVLSLKLAEIEIIKEETGEYPVLLLDDVMSELDKDRQQYLLENMGGIQTFITCTDSSIYEKYRTNGAADFFHVIEGNVTKH